MTRIRRNRGNAIAETGPALFLLLILTIFPCMTLLGLGAQFAFAWYHNHLVVEELAQRKAVDGGAPGPPVYPAYVDVSPVAFRNSSVGQQIKKGFDDQGLGKFIGVTLIDDNIRYCAANPNNAAETNRVDVRTTLTGKPFISLPFLGFTKMNFLVSGEAIREVTQ